MLPGRQVADMEGSEAYNRENPLPTRHAVSKGNKYLVAGVNDPLIQRLKWPRIHGI
jgi:hypothetical protein